jgi:hypothetical protein
LKPRTALLRNRPRVFFLMPTLARNCLIVNAFPLMQRGGFLTNNHCKGAFGGRRAAATLFPCGRLFVLPSPRLQGSQYAPCLIVLCCAATLRQAQCRFELAARARLIACARKRKP